LIISIAIGIIKEAST